MTATPAAAFAGTPAITLRELNRRIGGALASQALRDVWVTAELSDLRNSGGHCYFELIDKSESTGIVDSRLRGIIWAGNATRINSVFFAATGRYLSTGIRVMVKGSVNYHTAYGLSFVVSDIEPSFTMGDIERRRREILVRLKEEGILSLNKSLEWPEPALRIAVVSAQGAAGYGDFINQLYGNSSSLRFTTRLFPAVLQGERTAASIIEALDAINAQADSWDCVVIIRGGGATSDLVSFDSYDLASNVAQFPLPVIVGIGHERDVTVLDYVANMRVKTPTAAAEYLIGAAESTLERLRRLASDILACVRDRVGGCETQLAYMEGQLPTAPRNAMLQARSRLHSSLASLGSVTAGRIAPAMARLDRMPQMIAAAAANISRRQGDRLAACDNLLGALSPMATLRRGYSITRVNGAVVTSASEVIPGSTVETTLADGTITSITPNNLD